MIVGISGKKQSGKNTVALIWQYLYDCYSNNYTYPITVEDFKEYVKNNDHLKSVWQQKSFAHKIKQITCILLGCTMEQLEDPIFKETPLWEEWWVWKDCNDKLIPYKGNEDRYTDPYLIEEYLIKHTPRTLMQLLGTDFGRDMIHPNIWCNLLFSDYNGDFEEWVDIIDYENSYQISSFGRVKSLDRKIVYGEGNGQYHTKKSQFLKPTLSGGYETVSLSGKIFTVHSLVAKHFVKGYQEGFVVNHIDYNKTNNFYKNLEWVTQEDNIKHNKTTLRGNFGEVQKDAKLNSDKVLAIRKLIEDSTLSQNKIAKLFNVSPTTISEIKKGKKWNHVGEDIVEILPILPILTPNWIITDVRFFNEVKAIKDRGGILIRVDRDSDSKDSHISENDLITYKDWDYVIDNNYSLAELILRVRQIMFKEGIIYE